MATILVVDDEPTIRTLVKAALDGTGHEVVDAADGEAGLAAALRRAPDVALVDVALPRMNGLELCRRLKSTPGTASIRILLLTGLVQPADRQGATASGADGFVAKPFSPADLVSRIAALLRAPAPVSST